MVQLKELNTLCEWEHKLSVEQLEISTKAEKRAMNFELEVEDIATKMEQVSRRSVDSSKGINGEE